LLRRHLVPHAVPNLDAAQLLQVLVRLVLGQPFLKVGDDLIYPVHLGLVNLHLRHVGRRRQVGLQLGERHRRLHALLAYELLHALQVRRLVYRLPLSDLLVQLNNDGLERRL
jgi:hypothetical protein